MTVYQCEPDLEGILCGVYDAWASKKGHSQVRLEVKGEVQELVLFTEYVEVERDSQKAEKVFSAVRRKLSQEICRQIYAASLSCDPGRADQIYRYLVLAFQKGPSVADMLQLPQVYEIHKLCRGVWNEKHRQIEFIRFAENERGVLISRIGPKHDVLPLLSPYFADRLPDENWVIYDEGRSYGSVHPAGKKWFLARSPLEEREQEAWRSWLEEPSDEAVYQELWKIFFNTISIKERENRACQLNHLPLRFRPYMTEF